MNADENQESVLVRFFASYLTLFYRTYAVGMRGRRAAPADPLFRLGWPALPAIPGEKKVFWRANGPKPPINAPTAQVRFLLMKLAMV